jgi:hypothetical protein
MRLVDLTVWYLAGDGRLRLCLESIRDELRPGLEQVRIIDRKFEIEIFEPKKSHLAINLKNLKIARVVYT